MLASEVAAFGVRLQDDSGAWVDAWDSSTVVRSGALPIAAEVSVALLPEHPDPEELAPEPPVPFHRSVLLALRPLDLEETLGEEKDGDGEEEGEDLACVTVNECASRNQALVDQHLSQNPQLAEILQSIGGQCWKDHAASLPVPVTNCE